MTALSLDAAVQRLRTGEVLAYPTETVWGLGADACNESAVAALWAFKGRDAAAPVSILVSGPAALAEWGIRPEAAARRAIEAFWPGPLTAVLPCSKTLAPGVARADGALGLRCSPHPVASSLVAACERAGTGPLTATSCNRSGRPPARDRAEAERVCAGGGLDWLDASEDAGGGEPSTVVDFTGPRPRVLRWGGVSEAALAPVVGTLEAA